MSDGEQYSTPLTEQELLEIEQRTNATSPPPWKMSESELNGRLWNIGPICGYDGDALDVGDDDPLAIFLANVRADVPRLIATIRVLQEEIAHLKKDTP